ncbi:MAG: rhodanese-like domain-containing protein [Solirubrobacteraceae bacterium]
MSSTIAYEVAHQDLLRLADEDEFVRETTAGLPPQPPNFRAIVALNRGPLRLDGSEVHPLAPRQVERLQADGALVVDVRTDLQFDEAHIPGALSVTALRAGFGSKLAWLAEDGRTVVIVGRDDEDAHRAAALAGAVGVTDVAGFLGGGMTSWREERRPVARTARMTVPELRERWERDELQVLDVRERSEWDAGHIPGSIVMPYHDVRYLPEGIDPQRPVAVICASGQRAALGASLLAHHGAREVIHVVDGGVPQWQRRGWPVEAEPAAVR